MFKRLSRKIGHCTAVVTTPNASRRDPMQIGPFQDLLHGKVHADLPHAVGPIHHQTGPKLAHDMRSPPHVDAVDRQLFYVLGYPQNAMGVDAAQICIDKRIGQQVGIISRHAAAFKSVLNNLQ